VNRPRVQDAAVAVLKAYAPAEKARIARETAAAWRAGLLDLPGRGQPSCAPERPARPQQPALVAPGEVPRRKLSSARGRFALLHAVAHIEFNAIDLAFDLVARFGGDARIPDQDRRAFIDDWIGVGDDEARHFMMVCERLLAMGGNYGDLPAHDGLWSAAHETRGDLAARLAVAPMVLEARGLDVTPGMIARLQEAGDADSAGVLAIIYEEEIAHVAAGRRWFEIVCLAEGLDPQSRFQAMVNNYFTGTLKRPFNIEARSRAGLLQDWYEPLAPPPPQDKG